MYGMTLYLQQEGCNCQVTVGAGAGGTPGTLRSLRQGAGIWEEQQYYGLGWLGQDSAALEAQRNSDVGTGDFSRATRISFLFDLQFSSKDSKDVSVFPVIQLVRIPKKQSLSEVRISL